MILCQYHFNLYSPVGKHYTVFKIKILRDALCNIFFDKIRKYFFLLKRHLKIRLICENDIKTNVTPFVLGVFFSKSLENHRYTIQVYK